jgi:hypothetical protein
MGDERNKQGVMKKGLFIQDVFYKLAEIYYDKRLNITLKA